MYIHERPVTQLPFLIVRTMTEFEQCRFLFLAKKGEERKKLLFILVDLFILLLCAVQMKK